jgi:hypothetical protein
MDLQIHGGDHKRMKAMLTARITNPTVIDITPTRLRVDMLYQGKKVWI